MKRGYFLALALGMEVMPSGAMAQVMVTIAAKGPVVSLLAQDKAEVPPDYAHVLIDIVARNGDRAEAINDGNALLSKLKAALIAKGVGASDIERNYFGAREEFENEGGIRRHKDFALFSGYSVKIRKLDKLGEVVGAAIAAGATRISELSFEVENRAATTDRLLASATAKARAKAMDHAKINGFSNVRLLSVREPDAFAPPPPRYSPIDGLDIPADLSPRPVTISVSLAMAFELTN